MDPAPVAFHTSRRKLFLHALGALPSVAMGLYLALNPGSDFVARGGGWLLVALTGLSLVVAFAQGLRPWFVLRLDAEGVHVTHPNAQDGFFLPWRELTDVRVVRLDAPDRDWGTGDRPVFPRVRRRADRGRVGSSILLAPHFYDATPKALAEAIERFRRYYGAKGGEGKAAP